MANAKICDRCGELYSLSTSQEYILIRVKKHDPSVWTIRLQGDVLDLCDTCLDELTKWVQKGNELKCQSQMQ